MLFFLGATLLTTIYFNVNQSRVNQNINQRVQWLLEKANRQDCLAGIKKPSSPECRSLPRPSGLSQKSKVKSQK